MPKSQANEITSSEHNRLMKGIWGMEKQKNLFLDFNVLVYDQSQS